MRLRQTWNQQVHMRGALSACSVAVEVDVSPVFVPASQPESALQTLNSAQAIAMPENIPIITENGLKRVSTDESSGWRLYCLLYHVDSGPRSLFSHLENVMLRLIKVEQKACIFYVSASFPKS